MQQHAGHPGSSGIHSSLQGGEALSMPRPASSPVVDVTPVAALPRHLSMDRLWSQHYLAVTDVVTPLSQPISAHKESLSRQQRWFGRGSATEEDGREGSGEWRWGWCGWRHCPRSWKSYFLLSPLPTCWHECDASRTGPPDDPSVHRESSMRSMNPTVGKSKTEDSMLNLASYSHEDNEVQCTRQWPTALTQHLNCPGVFQNVCLDRVRKTADGFRDGKRHY